MCNGNCTCGKENHPVKGEPSSLTSIAFNTGVIVERKRIVKLLKQKATNWLKPNSLNFRNELNKLVSLIEQEQTNE
jgi:hypothetical protein